MDEVFDLKERNQWLRRNIKNLLQQLIRATYGDTINRYQFFFFHPILMEVDCSTFIGQFSSLGLLRSLKQSFAFTNS